MQSRERRRVARLLVGPALVLGALAACDSDPTEPPAEGVAETVLQFTNLAGSVPIEGDSEVACPAGGRIAIDGNHSLEREGGILTHRWDHTRRYDDCAVRSQRGTATANGELQSTGEVRFETPEGAGGDAELLYQKSASEGYMTVEHGGEVRTCEYDLETMFDPDAGVFHMTGVACGRTIDRTLPVPSTP